MQVKSIAECSEGSILQYFWPSLSYQIVIRIFVLSIFEWQFYTGFTVPYFESIFFFHNKYKSLNNSNVLKWISIKKTIFKDKYPFKSW